MSSHLISPQDPPPPGDRAGRPSRLVFVALAMVLLVAALGVIGSRQPTEAAQDPDCEGHDAVSADGNAAGQRTAAQIADDAYDRIERAEPIGGRIPADPAPAADGTDEAAIADCAESYVATAPTTATSEPTVGDQQTTASTTGPTVPGTGTTAMPSTTRPPEGATLSGFIEFTKPPELSIAVDLYAASGQERGGFLRNGVSAGNRYEFDVDPGCYVVVLLAPAGSRFSQQSISDDSQVAFSLGRGGRYLEMVGCVKEPSDSFRFPLATLFSL